MEQQPINESNSESTGTPITKAEVADLEQKVNVDSQAIEEAREAVGDDEEKIREYLINNRGL